jgi:hypothetical protein
MYDIRGEWCGSRRLVVDEPLSLPHQPGPSRITETTTFHGAGMAMAVALTLGAAAAGSPQVVAKPYSVGNASVNGTTVARSEALQCLCHNRRSLCSGVVMLILSS